MNVEFHHKATAEVRAAVAFYETEQVGLGGVAQLASSWVRSTGNFSTDVDQD